VYRVDFIVVISREIAICDLVVDFLTKVPMVCIIGVYLFFSVRMSLDRQSSQLDTNSLIEEKNAFKEDVLNDLSVLKKDVPPQANNGVPETKTATVAETATDAVSETETEADPVAEKKVDVAVETDGVSETYEQLSHAQAEQYYELGKTQVEYGDLENVTNAINNHTDMKDARISILGGADELFMSEQK
jgi:hypothetical protein